MHSKTFEMPFVTPWFPEKNKGEINARGEEKLVRKINQN